MPAAAPRPVPAAVPSRYLPLPLRAHVKGELPGEIDAIVRRCLSKERGERYASMESLSGALRAFAGGD